MPAVRAGLAMLARYRYAPQPLLTCPITGFAGSEDKIFSVDSQRLWAMETTGPFELFVLPGDHLFVRDQADLITTKIRQELNHKAAPREELMEAAK